MQYNNNFIKDSILKEQFCVEEFKNLDTDLKNNFAGPSKQLSV